MNPNGYAIVYLFEADLKQEKINHLQYESILVKEKTKEEDDDGEGNENHQGGDSIQKSYKINNDKILESLKGLNTYQEPNKDEVNKYLSERDPFKLKNNFFFFILQLFCLVTNFVVLTMR